MDANKNFWMNFRMRQEQFPDGRERETLRLPGTKKVPELRWVCMDAACGCQVAPFLGCFPVLHGVMGFQPTEGCAGFREVLGMVPVRVPNQVTFEKNCTTCFFCVLLWAVWNIT